MRRREFIAGIGAAAVWPPAAGAQQGERVGRIGVLMPENNPASKSYVAAFTHALAGLGWTDGRNVRMDFRWYGADTNRTRKLAHELVGLQPDIILTSATPASAAVQQETRTIPMVFVNVGDPVVSGLVTSLNRPGGNITGFATFGPSLGGKWLELLLEIAPGLKRAAVMFNPDTSAAARSLKVVPINVPSFETAARSLKVVPIIAPVHGNAEIETAIIALGREPGGGLVVLPELFTYEDRASIISAAARNNVPAVYALSEFAKDGGLLSYGPAQIDNFRRAATYVDRILRGAKPAELPVQFSTKFDLALNLKTAKALGLTIPPNLLALADEVIE